MRQTERSYWRNIALEINEVNTSDPKKIWDPISKPGPRKTTKIPHKIYKDGQLTSDKLHVLKKWEDDFSSLFVRPNINDTRTGNEFYKRILEENDNYERTKNHNVHLNVENDNFNRPFTIDELTAVQPKLKNKKATGIDEIPNEVLKLSKISNLKLTFINYCFSLSVVPTLWQQDIITPIPKSSTKDPYMPLSYRGISLLSCMYKLYSSLINTRLCNFAE